VRNATSGRGSDGTFGVARCESVCWPGGAGDAFESTVRLAPSAQCRDGGLTSATPVTAAGTPPPRSHSVLARRAGAPLAAAPEGRACTRRSRRARSRFEGELAPRRLIVATPCGTEHPRWRLAFSAAPGQGLGNFRSGARAARAACRAGALLATKRECLAGACGRMGHPRNIKAPCLQCRFPNRGRACRIYSQRRRCN
jgi:hypothetical protein